jgi:hypothetical protein
MIATRPITFAVAVNNRGIFENNFLASPCLREHPHYQILVEENFDSAAKAFNDAINRSVNVSSSSRIRMSFSRHRGRRTWSAPSILWE